MRPDIRRRLEANMLGAKEYEQTVDVSKPQDLTPPQPTYPSVDEQYKTLERQKEEVQEEYAQQVPWTATQSPDLIAPVPELEERQQSIDLSQKILKDAERIRNTAEKGANLWTGATDAKAWKDFATFGMDELMKNFGLLDVVDRAKSGQELSEEDQSVLDAYATFSSIQKETPLPLSHRVGTVLPTSLGLMSQIVATQGLPWTKAAEQGAKHYVSRLVGSGMKQGVGKLIVEKGIPKLASGVAGAATQAPLTPMMWTDYSRRRTPDIQFDETGNAVPVSGTERGVVPSLYESYIRTGGEIFAEKFGDDLLTFQKQAFGKGALSKLGDKISGTPFGVATKKVTDKVPFSPLNPYEIIEEEIMIPIEVLSNDREWSNLTNKEEQLEIILGTAFLGGVIGTAQSMGTVYDYNKLNNKKKTLNKFGSGLSANVDNILAEKRFDTQSQQISGLLENLPAEGRNALLDYSKTKIQFDVAKAAVESGNIEQYQQLVEETQRQAAVENLADGMTQEYVDLEGNVTTAKNSEGNDVIIKGMTQEGDKMVYVVYDPITGEQGLSKDVAPETIVKMTSKEFRDQTALQITEQTQQAEQAKQVQQEQQSKEINIGDEVAYKGKKWTVQSYDPANVVLKGEGEYEFETVPTEKSFDIQKIMPETSEAAAPGAITTPTPETGITPGPEMTTEAPVMEEQEPQRVKVDVLSDKQDVFATVDAEGNFVIDADIKTQKEADRMVKTLNAEHEADGLEFTVTKVKSDPSNPLSRWNYQVIGKSMARPEVEASTQQQTIEAQPEVAPEVAPEPEPFDFISEENRAKREALESFAEKTPSAANQLYVNNEKELMPLMLQNGASENSINVVNEARKSGAIEAFYEPGTDTIYFVLDNLAENETDIFRVWVHEQGLHKGLRLLLPNAEQRNKFLADFINNVGGIDALIKQEPSLSQYSDNEVVLAEEYFALIAEKILTKQDLTLSERGFVDAFLDAIRKLIDSIFGINTSYSKEFAHDLIATTFAKIKEPALATDAVLKSSKNPNEIHTAYLEEERNAPINNLAPWEEDLLHIQINQSSYEQFADKNTIGQTMARAWFGKDLGNLGDIDVIAQELSEMHGVEITPDDVVEFINNHPSKYVRKTTGIQRELARKYRKLTGQSIKNHGKQKAEVTEDEFEDIPDNAFSDEEMDEVDTIHDQLLYQDEQNPAVIDKLLENGITDLKGLAENEWLFDGSVFTEEDYAIAENYFSNLEIDKENARRSEEETIETTGEETVFAQEAIEKSEVAEKFEEDLAREEAKVDTNPSEAQKEAENYRKGHVNFKGLGITIENPKGSTRSGTDAEGKPWEVTMNNTYGYFKNTEGKDGDQIDVFLGENMDSPSVFVVDQVNEDGSFDEHKVMMGFNSAEEARDNYIANYSEGWTGFGNITEVAFEDFKNWVEKSGKKRKAFAEYVDFAPPLFSKIKKANDEIDKKGVFVTKEPSQLSLQFDDGKDFTSQTSKSYIQWEENQAKTDDSSITFSERLMSEQNNFMLIGEPLMGAPVVKDAGDVANIFKNLESASSENSFAVLHKNDGSYKVLYISTGGTTGTVAEPKYIIAAAKEYGADNVTFVHNHPSGNLKLSIQDKQVHEKMEESLLPLGIGLNDSVIINLDSGKYGLFNSKSIVSQEVEKKEIGEEIPLSVYSFDRQKLYVPSVELTKLTSIDDVAVFLSKVKRGTTPGVGVVVLNRMNSITRYSFLDESLSPEQLIEEIMYEVSKYGESVILNTNSKIDGGLISNINKALSTVNASLLDVVENKVSPEIIEAYTSMINEPQVMFSKGSVKASPLKNTKDLVALHNLTGANILHADKLGGIPVPSIAVTKATLPFESFGNITLIADKSLIEDYAAKTFDTDVYSPRSPRRYYRVSSAAENAFIKKYRGEIGENYGAQIARIANNALYKMREALKESSPEEFAERFSAEYETEPRIAFLSQKGIPLKPVYLPRKVSTGQYQGYEVSKEDIDYIKSNPDIFSSFNTEDLGTEKHEKLSKWYYDFLDKKAKKEATDEKRLDENLYEVLKPDEKTFSDEGKLPFGYAARLSESARKAVGKEREIDSGVLRKRVNKKFTNAMVAEMKDWLAGLAEEAQGEAYFEAGRKKLPYTLDNLVDAMSGRIKGQEGTMFHSLWKAKSMGAKKFTNIEQIRKQKERLVSSEEFEAIKEDLDFRFSELVEQMNGNYVYDNMFGRLDDMSQAIADFYKTKNASVALSRNGYRGVSAENKREFAEFARDLLSSPTEYFESKIQRAVRLNEFKAAVVPKNTSPAVLDVLEKNNIIVKKYDPRKEEDRQKKVELVSRQTDVRFSISKSEENFDKWKGENEVVEADEIGEIKTGTPIIAKAYHGTTHPFNVFEGGELGNIGGHLGAINYFTSDYYDAMYNYLSTGADLTNRIELRKENLGNELEDYVLDEKLDYEAISKDYGIQVDEIKDKRVDYVVDVIAKKELLGQEEQVMELFLKMNNPLVLGKNPIYIDTYDEADYIDYMDDATEEIADENGISIEEAKEDFDFDIRQRAIENTYTDNKIVIAMENALRKNGAEEDVYAILGDAVHESEVDLNQLEKYLRKNENLAYVENDEGQLASAQVISDFLLNLGYDGIILNDVEDRFPGMNLREGISHIHISDDYQNRIKLADGSNVTFQEESTDIRFSKTGFYSPTERALGAIKQEKGSIPQFKSMLLKNGAKQAELDWMGWDDFAKDKKTVTKDEIQNWIDGNKIEIEEVEKASDLGMEVFDKNEAYDLFDMDIDVYGIDDEGNESLINSREEIANYNRFAHDDDFKEAVDDTKYSEYVVPGGENYKELLLTMPSIETWSIVDNNDNVVETFPSREKAFNKMNTSEFNKFAIESKKQYRLKANRGDFRSSHFAEPNILAHVRMNERTDSEGNNVLFIEELQSDWAQEGRKKGFVDEGKQSEYNKIQEEWKKVEEELSELQFKARTPEFVSLGGLKGEDARRLSELEKLDKEYSDKLRNIQPGTIPSMPFKKTDQWGNLALRRVMQYAAENGFDKIAWTTGEQQAERYDLSKQVEKIDIENKDNGVRYVKIFTAGQSYNSFDVDKNGTIIKHAQWEGKKLDEVVGKEMADKILSTDTDKSFSGLDLKVGGEGMKAFYDKIVPALVKKLTKKFGAKFGISKFENPNWKGWKKAGENDWINTITGDYSEGEPSDLNREYFEQPSIELTDKLKETVINEGVPLFSKDSFSKSIRKAKRTDESKFDYVNRKFFDYMSDVKKMQDKIVELGGTVGLNNPYRAETLSHGRVVSAKDNYDKNIFEPLLDEIVKIGKLTGENYDGIMTYMMAKHAPERNAYLAEKTGIEGDFAGIENHEEIVNTFEAKIPESQREKAISDLWDATNKATDYTINRWLSDGFINREVFDEIKGREWKHYVPLRGWDDAASDTFDYLKAGSLGGDFNFMKEAKGRTSKADDPVANIQSMAYTSIVAGEKNRVKQAAFLLAAENANNEEVSKIISAKKVYFVKEGEDSEGNPTGYETLEKPSQELFDEGKVSVGENIGHYKNAKPYEAKQHEVPVMLGGEKYVTVFPEESLYAAQALNKQNLYIAGWVENSVGKVTRFMIANFTAKNPAFVIPNFLRDVAYGAAAASIKEGKGVELLTHVGRAMKAVKQNEFSGKTEDSDYNDFLNLGGVTGYVQLEELDQVKRDIQKKIKRHVGENSIFDKVVFNKAVLGIDNALTGLATISENSIRFAAYLSKLNEDKTNKEEAAEFAKEITVNFNRKGEWSTGINNLFAFFNVGLQGGKNFLKLAKANPGKFMAVGLSFMTAGFLVEFLQSMLWGDDDDFNNINKYLKRNYLTVKTSEEKYMTIPLPPGFRSLYAMGVIAAQVARGNYKEENLFLDVAETVSDAMLPHEAQPSNWIDDEGKFNVSVITPTAFDPIVDVAKNEDFAGRMIAKEAFTRALEDKIPASQLHKYRVAPFYKSFTDLLFEIGGGDKEMPSKYFVGRDGKFKKVKPFMDINPSKLQYLVEGYGGGRLKFFNKTVKSAENGLKAITGETPEEAFNEIPVLWRFYRDVPHNISVSEYYKVKNEVAAMKHTIHEQKKAGKKMYSNEAVNIYSRIAIFDRYDKRINRLNDIIYNSKNYDDVRELLDERDNLIDNLKKEFYFD